jgi:transcriptional regulator with XRE-family HTH domain
MAPRVGQALSEARTQRGIALNDVERITGIGVQQLRAMEEGRWDQLPARAETRRLISAYASYLGIDDKALLEEYERSIRGGSRSSRAPTGILRPVRPSRERPRRPPALWAAGAIGLIALGLVLVAALGSNGGGGSNEPAAGQKRTDQGTAPTTAQTTTAASNASLELSATADVWVCLEKANGSQPVNGETLTAGERRGPFTSPSFALTLGNGSIELTANGDPVKVPDVSEPLGFRITPGGAKRLSAGNGPSCA